MNVDNQRNYSFTACKMALVMAVMVEYSSVVVSVTEKVLVKREQKAKVWDGAGPWACSHPVTLQVSLNMTTRGHLPNNTTILCVRLCVCKNVQQSHVEHQL